MIGKKETEKRVLVVDSESSVRQQLPKLVYSMGTVSHVDTAANGREGLERIASAGYDVLITGVEMPEMDGFKLIQSLDEAASPVPQFKVVISKKRIRLLQHALYLGCFDFISRPFTKKNIRRLFDRMDIDYPLDFRPRIYAFVGAKCVGKSEILGFLEAYVPGFMKMHKYSSRARANRDSRLSDTRPLSELPDRFPEIFAGLDPGLREEKIMEIVERNIHWYNHGHQYCILVDDIRGVLAQDMDCGVAIAKYDGAASLQEHFPGAEICVIDADDNLISTILDSRADDHTHLLNIILTRDEFRDHFRGTGKIWTNSTFFDMANEASTKIYLNRTGEYP